MSKYIDEKDFIRRTRRLVEEFTLSDYEVTFLINCCLGLLVFPRERLLNSSIESKLGKIDLDGWGVDPNDPKFISGRCKWDGNPTDVECVAKHIRDSLSHALFQLCPVNENFEEIKYITFDDDDGFHLCITVENFKKFVIKYATEVERLL